MHALSVIDLGYNMVKHGTESRQTQATSEAPGLQLTVDSVDVYYGLSRALSKVTFEVKPGEACAVLGPNGAGKSTLMKAIMGFVPLQSGKILLDNRDITGSAPRLMARLGIALVPEGRRVFSSLSVEDNLRMGAYQYRDESSTDNKKIYEVFPALYDLRKQRAGTLSGGQQQMVAIGRALMARPRLLLLDEPSLGLAPRIVGEVFEAIAALHAMLGISVLLIEQNARQALNLVDTVVMLEVGRVIGSGSKDIVMGDAALDAAYFGGEV